MPRNSDDGALFTAHGAREFKYEVVSLYRAPCAVRLFVRTQRR